MATGRTFFRVPHDAMRFAVSPWECALVLQLYRWANDTRGQPFSVTMRDLAKAGGTTRSSAQRLINSLCEAGLFAKETSHATGTMLRCTSWDTTWDTTRDTSWDTHESQEHLEEPSESGDGPSAVGHQMGHHLGHHLGPPPTTYKKKKEEEEEDTGPRPVLKLLPDPEPTLTPFEQLVAYWGLHQPVPNGNARPPAPKLLPKRGVGKALREAISAFGSDRVLKAMRWACEAEHRDAKWLRSNRPLGARLLQTICYHVESYSDSWSQFGESASNISYKTDTRPIVGVREEAFEELEFTETEVPL